MARVSPLVVLPPLIFAGLAVIFFIGLNRENPNAPPSAREGGPAPELTLLQLGPEPPFSRDELTAPGVKLVNYWASWCAPCRVEHPQLEALAEEGIPIYGINYKDDPEKALAFLEELGNPFAGMGADPEGRTALDWGVAGVPETYVLDGEGTIILRFAGPLTQRVIERRIRPAMEAASGD